MSRSVTVALQGLFICLCISGFLGETALANSNAAAKKQLTRTKSTRIHLQPEEICRNLPAFLPFLCNGVKFAFSWAFGDEHATYIFEICYNYQIFNSKGRRRRRRGTAETGPSVLEGNAKEFLELRSEVSETSENQFADGELEAFFTAANSEHPANPDAVSPNNKTGLSGFKAAISRKLNALNYTSVCHKVIKFSAKMCQSFLGKTIANKIRNFGWLCYFTSDTSTMCYQSIKSLGRLCRVTTGEEDFDFESLNATMIAPPPSPADQAALPLSPIETCKSFAPSLFAMCRYFKRAVVLFFGNLIGKVVLRACTFYFDGFVHLFPWHWFKTQGGQNSTQVASGISSSPGNGTTIAEQEQAQWSYGGLIPNSATALQKMPDNSDRKRRGILPDFVLDIFSKASSQVNKLTLEMCSAIVDVLAPLCQKLGFGKASFSRYSWVCFLSGRLSGACLVFVQGASGLCKADARVCDPDLPGSNFSCQAHMDGYFADPVYECASFYYHCRIGNPQPALISCYQGRGFVFDKSINNCRKKSEMPQCHNIVPPCLPLTSADNENIPRKPELVCDYTMPPMGGDANEKKIRKIVAQLEDEEAARAKTTVVTVADFNCTGRKDGRYNNPHYNCSYTYVKCRNGMTSIHNCRYYEDIFDANSQRCIPRSHVIECALPPCPADHPLRHNCDPKLPTLPPDYDPNTFQFNCTSRPYGLYEHPYEPCANHFFVCKGAQAAAKLSCSVLGDKKEKVFVQRLQKCMPLVSVGECWNKLPPCAHEWRAT